MRFFWAAVRKDLLRRVRSPLAPVIMLLFPVVFSLLIGLAFGSHGEKIAPVKIAVVDEDGGFLSNLIRSSFTQNQAAGRFELVLAPDSLAGLRLVEANKVSAMLRIPAGFSDSVFSSHPTRLVLVKNPAQGIYPEIAEQYVKVLAQLGSAAVQVLNGPLQQIRNATRAGVGPPESFISTVSVAISRRMRGVARYAIPPAVRLQKPASKAPAKGKSDDSPFQIAAYVLPGMAVFALLMLSLVLMGDFQRESVRGTLSRQFVAPVPFLTIILGKLAATWMLSLLCILVLALLAIFWVGAGISIAGFLALSVIFSLATTGFAAFLQCLSRSERTGSVVGSILVMIMSMMGGSFVPLDSLPAFARKIAPFTLNYWGNEGYRTLLFDHAGIGRIAPNLAVLAILGAVLTSVALARFQRRFSTGG